MPRNVPAALAADIAKGAHTLCYLLKIMPAIADTFGLTTTNIDVAYDDGTGSITYRAKKGYTRADTVTKSDMSVNNSEADGLIAQYPLDGVTIEGISRGDYDGARYIQYLINYEATSHGHAIIDGGTVGRINISDGMGIQIELRSLIQTAKQNSLIELTSITDRARLGDARNKVTLVWLQAQVTAVGDEVDRTFTVRFIKTLAGITILTGDGSADVAQLVDDMGTNVVADYAISAVYIDGTATTDYADDGSGLLTFGVAPASGSVVTWDGGVLDPSTVYASDYFNPGVVHWESGQNENRELEIEEYGADGSVTLMIPAQESIEVGDLLRIRQDSDGAWATAVARGYYLNFRGEPFIPRADGSDLQSPTHSA